MSINGIDFVKKGEGLGKTRDKQISKILKERDISLVVDLRLGKHGARIWTTDLSYEYIKINASYRT
jgi:glutamate N-acetyltransferase / amino-acid N-acetyltransferase